MMTQTVKAAQLQDLFLTDAIERRMPLTVFLVNGFQLRGTIVGYDSFTVVLDSEGRQNMIYKHAISTITPIRPLDMEDKVS